MQLLIRSKRDQKNLLWIALDPKYNPIPIRPTVTAPTPLTKYSACVKNPIRSPRGSGLSGGIILSYVARMSNMFLGSAMTPFSVITCGRENRVAGKIDSKDAGDTKLSKAITLVLASSKQFNKTQILPGESTVPKVPMVKVVEFIHLRTYWAVCFEPGATRASCLIGVVKLFNISTPLSKDVTGTTTRAPEA